MQSPETEPGAFDGGSFDGGKDDDESYVADRKPLILLAEDDLDVQDRVLKREENVGADHSERLAEIATQKEDTAAKLKATPFDINAIAAPGLNYEQLDQLVIDLLLGARG